MLIVMVDMESTAVLVDHNLLTVFVIECRPLDDLLHPVQSIFFHYLQLLAKIMTNNGLAPPLSS